MPEFHCKDKSFAEEFKVNLVIGNANVLCM